MATRSKQHVSWNCYHQATDHHSETSFTSVRLMNVQSKQFSATSIIGLVVEFIVAIDEARVRFTDDALTFLIFYYLPG